MPEEAAREGLRLREEFPPVSREEWEAAIAADLRGAGYEKRLVWKSGEGIAVRPYYRREDVPEGIARPMGPGGWEMLDELPQAGIVNAIVWHESGGTAVQELALAMAAGSDELAAGRAVTGMAFAVGSNYFFEIAKLRAARLLWVRVAEAYSQSGELKLYAVTALSNKSIYDPYTNLLRAATEALSAVAGGCDGLLVQAAGFAPRLGKNVQLMLKEEAHLDKVADPAGGSYYVEALTDALAREAWAVFQRLESDGGYAKSLGEIDVRLAASREAKEQAVASRRRTLVGVNNYPDVNERELDKAGSIEGAGWRLARPLEEIRLRTERHARKTGRRPKVLLLKRGELKMQMARATFCQNFFGCAGFAIEESDSYEGTGAALVVLCAPDAEYAGLAREVCPQVNVPVVVAGHPKEQLEALQAAGVAGFVHVRSNIVETLREWQDRLGVGGREEL